MSSERDLGFGLPIQIVQLSERLEGARISAHGGNSGNSYKCEELVRKGPLTNDSRIPLVFMFLKEVRHTHRKTGYKKDGVPVALTFLTSEEIARLKDDKLPPLF